MDFKLRRIELDDAGLFCEALNSVILEKVYLGSAVEVSEESIRPFVESVINNHYPQAVAIADKKIVGWCDITPGRRTHTTHVGHLGMGVIASHRHHGIGSKLLQEGISQAVSAGLEKIELEVYADNEIAIALYRQFEFSVEGTRLRARKMEDKYQDVVHMAKFLI